MYIKKLHALSLFIVCIFTKINGHIHVIMHYKYKFLVRSKSTWSMCK